MTDRERLLEEWYALFEKIEKCYIYGAANTARKIFQIAINTGVADKIEGFVVTSEKENCTRIENLPVVDIHNLRDKHIFILVPHAGIFREEICELLRTLEFHNVCLIHRFCILQTQNTTNDDSVAFAEDEQIKKYETLKSVEEREKDRLFRETLVKMREEGQPEFGQNQFYQSLEKIGLSGIRPTLYRIEKYELKTYLKKQHDVLDIGCNVGFLDITIAENVHTVTGIEYNSCLVSIADSVKEYLCVDNCNFVNSDFQNWNGQNVKKFDVIFSFAVHHWLNLEPQEYANMADKLLKNSGCLWFESHDLSEPDKEYEDCLECWKSKGWDVMKRDNIMDAGTTQREFVILRKP